MKSLTQYINENDTTRLLKKAQKDADWLAVFGSGDKIKKCFDDCGKYLAKFEKEWKGQVFGHAWSTIGTHVEEFCHEYKPNGKETLYDLDFENHEGYLYDDLCEYWAAKYGY